MADSVAVITGAAGNINVSTRTNASGEHMQVCSVGVDGSDSIVPTTVANGLLVDVSRVTGSVTVDSELTLVDVDTTGVTANVAGVALIGSSATGAQVIPGDATTGIYVNVQSMPGASRLTDSVSAALVTDAIMNGVVALTPKFAKANIAASTTDGAIVTAVGGKKIRPLEYRLHAGATATNCTFTSKPGGAGSAISELFALGANSGRADGFNPVGHFETATGEGLSMTTGAGSTTGVGVVYVEV